ncbi:MAG: hypothetical protein JW726_13080 [Anaerolineales bacterium]|nr:hypothetical protein [Anaerolineales bacterium]
MKVQHLLAIMLVLSLILGVVLFPNKFSIAQEGGRDWVNYTMDRDAEVIAPQGNTLWVGTWGGVLRWDLTTGNYAKFTTAEGLSNNMVHDIAIDGQGRVWVGTDQGLSVFENGSWVSYDKTNSGIPGETVTIILVGADDRIWLHSREINGSLGVGVTVFNGATWTTYNESNSSIADDDIRSMAVDQNGHLWFGTWDGDVSEFDGTNWTTYPDINYNSNEIFAITVDSLNRKWFVSYNYLVQRYDGISWESYLPENGCNDLVSDVIAGEDGLVWFATLSGVCSFDGTTWTRYHTDNSGLVSNSIASMASQGSKLWVGYSLLADGITQFDGSQWNQYLTMTGLPENIYEEGLRVDDQTWFGASPGVVVFDGASWTAYDNTNSELVGACVNEITAQENGHLWFAGGNCGGGIVEFDGVNWIQHYEVGVFPDPFVYAIAAAPDGRIWAGSRDGLSVYNDITWTNYLPGTQISAIAIDGLGNIWANCLTRFDGTNWNTYATVEAAIEANYLAIKDTFFENEGCWLADNAGRVWVTKGQAGVSSYNGSTWTAYSLTTMGHTLPFGWYARLAGEDADGNIWVILMDNNLTHGRLSRFNGTTWTAFTHADGIIEPPGAMTVDHLNRVWFAGFRGFSIFYDSMQPTGTLVSPLEGGELTSSDTSTHVVFPAGSFATDVLVTLTPTQTVNAESLVGIGHAFELSAVISGTTTPVSETLIPYTLTVRYTGDEVWGINESGLAIYRWDGGEWVMEPNSSLDRAANLVAAQPAHLGLFAVLGESVEALRWFLPFVIVKP